MFSVSASSDEVASSSKIIGVSFKIALAIESLCFSPPDNLTPSSPMMVSYLFGSFSINSSAKAFFAANITSSSDAFGFAYFILNLIVSSKRVVFWLTREMLFLKENIEEL